MSIVGRSGPLVAAVLALVVSLACSSNVPQGFGSGDYTTERTLAAPCDVVFEAAREFLRDRGDVPEVTAWEQGGVLRTGDLRIEVAPRESSGSLLRVHQAKYVGRDYAQRAIEIADAIVARVEG